MNRFKYLCGLLIALQALSAATTPGESSEVGESLPVMPVAEIHRGQVGHGLSVFAGTEPLRFEVEVLGVLPNTTPELSYIVARLSGQNLEHSGILAGMSGSPVYIDERLVGAVSFSYLFGLDPIAGITPIAAMRRLSELGPAGSKATRPKGVATSTSSLRELQGRNFPAAALSEALSLLQPAETSSRSTLHWTAAGFSTQSVEILRSALGSLAAAGGGGPGPLAGATTAAGGSEELIAGGAVSAVLVSGDLSLAAHGTITERQGDEILAFGHPLFSLGPTKIPMATSEVVTVIPSRFNSFKLSNAGRVVGAFDQDREAGARGVVGLQAPMIPLRVSLRGLTRRDYSMQVADLAQLSPAMVAISTLGALSAGSFSAGPQGIDMEATIRLQGHSDLRILQSFDGDQAGVDSAVYLLSFMSYLMQNSMEKVRILGVEVLLRQVDWIRLSDLVAVEAKQREVRPGDTVDLVLTLQPYRGESFRQHAEFVLPRDVPQGNYYLMVGDGTSMDAVRVAVEKRQPKTLAQSLEILNSFGSRRQLRIFGLRAGAGLATGGEVLPMLPGSVRSIFGAGSTTPGEPLRLAIHHREEEWLERPFVGVHRIDLKVKAHP